MQPSEPPFVPNDETRPMCLHACVQMVMKACHAKPVFSFDEIDQILKRKEEEWAAPFALFPKLKKQGFDISFISAFSFSRFVKEPEQYILDFCGPIAGPVQLRHTDVQNDVKNIRALLRDHSAHITERPPTITDIRNYLSNGWYAMPLVNSRALYGYDGYRGHFVLAYACDDKTITLHDPGLRPRPAQTISWNQLDRSWMFENQKSRALSCFRRIQEQKVSNG